MAEQSIESLTTEQQTTFRSEIGAAPATRGKSYTDLGSLGTTETITAEQLNAAAIFVALLDENCVMTLPQAISFTNDDWGREFTLMLSTSVSKTIQIVNGSITDVTSGYTDPITLPELSTTSIMCKVFISSTAYSGAYGAFWGVTVGPSLRNILD